MTASGRAAVSLMDASCLLPPRRGLDHMGMAAPIYYTAEMVRALPEDGKRYETVHGELLVTPAPRMWHQVVLDRLRDGLKAYLVRHPEWHLFAAPADISWAPDVLVQPDLFVVPIEEARTLDWARLRHVELRSEEHTSELQSHHDL